MQELMKTKMLPLLILILILGVLMLAAPITASAEEPLEDEEYYDEYYDEYYGDYYDGYYDEYTEALPDEDMVELPDEYYDYGGSNVFTPDGTGTVIDNATDGDGKEFYTIETPDGNVFYLVIDRQRSTDNVYFLGAVTEEDLMSLAQIEKKPENTVTTFPNDIEADENPSDDEAAKPKTETAPASPPSKDDLMLYVIIGVAVIGVGGAGYYLKIVKPKKEGSTSYDDDYGEDYGDDGEDNSGYAESNNDQYDDNEEYYEDENGYEDEADMDFDDSTAPSASDGYHNNDNTAQQQSSGNSPPNQPNRSTRRRRKKRRNPNYSG